MMRALFRPVLLRRVAPSQRLQARRGVAALEFAIVAPVMSLLIWGVWDVARALIAWEEACHAAQAIAQAAEKMSVSGRNYPPGVNGGGPISSLTDAAMQNAMTTIYAEMPFLNKGNANGAMPGAYAVSLSGVAFWPLCPATANSSDCPKQTPHTLWSSYMTQGGAHLIIPPPLSTSRYRLCGDLTPVAQFPDDSSQLTKMIDPNNFSADGKRTVLIPQVVADVVYVFQPTFPLLGGKTFTFYASATFPAPLGGNDQSIVFDATHSTLGNTVENCADGGAV